ncbi:CheY chemotaxis protein or a CheY-like REC (receiver) domain [Cyclobacterium lianum]|uniref:CheY chemotaxis protein or a CheY-like REC (Receiver) domain n=1 Tax=Cyclobacterium lianum TaxID=388280 RepID=A0A1M7N9A3_9BACT|nr:response regulator [Cyclobacterium lianum]SHN00192.1 CheY chemotaxis protein or a CheY-like REC (receiver) domain [Cyclobacterium lianum]
MKNKKVLIVDDNALNRRVFENVIGHNYFFESASDGMEAIEMLRKNSYDIVLMDIQMPKLDGISCLKIIKEEEITDIPIIAISAYSNQGDREYFLSTGFDDFIAKPVKPKDLLETIHHHLQPGMPPAAGKENEPDNEADLNESVIHQLLKYHNLDNIKAVYHDFLEEAESLTEEIKNLAELKKFEEIGEKLHILKGNSGTLGVFVIHKATAGFEKKIKQSSHNDIQKDIAQLEEGLKTYRKLIENDKIFTKYE